MSADRNGAQFLVAHLEAQGVEYGGRSSNSER
jgi:hypothetical protein